MDELLLRFQNMVLNNPDSFLSQESKNFPDNYKEEDKVKSEFIGLHSYYHDKNSNEAFFNSNQSVVIQKALDEIKELILQKDYETAKYYIVSLQLLLGLEIKFNKIIYIMIQSSISVSDFIDEEQYFDKEDPYIDKRRK